MRSPRTATAVAVLSLTLLAACGEDDDGSDSTEVVTETVTPSETTTPTDETSDATSDTASVTPMDPTDGEITQEQVEAALLTPEEIGSEFVLGDYVDEDTPPLCDPEGTPLDVAIPPAVSGGTQIDHTEGIAAMQEEIAIYTSEAEATEAFTLATEGLSCSEGSLDGSPVTIGPAQDVTTQVNTTGLGTSTAWEVSSDSFTGVVVATLAGRVIVACTFLSAPDADTSALPQPVDIATDAFAKALAN